MKIQAAILVALVLAVSGCAADKDEAETADTSSQSASKSSATEVATSEPSASKSRAIDLLRDECDLEDRGIEECTPWLKKLILETYDAYDDAGSPDSAFEYNESLVAMTSNYWSEYRCDGRPGTGTTQCQTLYGNIVSTVESLLDELP